MNLKHHLPLVGRLYKQRDKARAERNAAINQTKKASGNIGDYTLTTHRGLTLLLDKKNVLDRDIANLGNFENEQLDYLTEQAIKLLKQDSQVTFLDVGTNWGLYTLTMAAAGVKNLHAFEPDARNIAHLQTNLLLNGALEKTKIHALAVWKESGEVSFATTAENETRDRGWAQIISEETPAIEDKKGKKIKLGTTTLPAVSLDDAFAGMIHQTLILKIDTEGAEAQVLQGASHLLAQNAVLIQVENHAHNRKEFLKKLPKNLSVVHTIEPDLYLANPAMQKKLGL